MTNSRARPQKRTRKEVKSRSSARNREETADRPDAAAPTPPAPEDLARAVLIPTAQAAVTLADYNKAFGEVSLPTLIDDLKDQCAATSKGDLARAEAMLTAQTHTLDAIFNHMARKATRCEYLGQADAYLRLALKAQGQCRATWATLAAMKNPQPTTFVRQANIAHGPQQVNNGSAALAAPAGLPRIENSQNKLLELQNGERMDFRTAGAPSAAYSRVAAMDALDGSQDRRR